MSTTDPGPPHRFHAIFHAAAASATAVDFKSSPAVVEKMMAAGSRDRVDNRDNNNGSKNRSTSSTRQCREGCLEKVIIISSTREIYKKVREMIRGRSSIIVSAHV